MSQSEKRSGLRIQSAPGAWLYTWREHVLINPESRYVQHVDNWSLPIYRSGDQPYKSRHLIDIGTYLAERTSISIRLVLPTSLFAFAPIIHPFFILT